MRDRKGPFRKMRRPGGIFAGIALALVTMLLLVQALAVAAKTAVVANTDRPLAQVEPAPGPVTVTVPPGVNLVRVPELSQSDNLTRYLEMHTITASGLISPDLSSSSKSVDKEEATAGSTLAYTVVLSNSGDSAATDVVMTDTLPAAVTYEEGSLQIDLVNGLTLGSGADNGVITWTGSLGPQGSATIIFSGILTSGLPLGTVVTNTAEITGTGALITRAAATEVVSVSAPLTTTLYMPIIHKPLPTTSLQVSRPNSANQWTVSWTSGGSDATGYQLQESGTPDFSQATDYNLGPVTSHPIDHEPSIHNKYYYRVRALSGSVAGPWSDTVSVIGGYRDDFTDNNSGWVIRRTTFLDEIDAFYEIDSDKDWFILRVEDSWDWGIASPMAEAPSVPYVIEYRSKHANLGNLVSHGAVFGGDWPGTICPDYSSLDGLYRHQLCFNHFYNINTIWYGKLKLLFERVDYLEWRPQDGGSPMKRGSFDDFASWFVVDPIPGVESSDWNTWRVEVRTSGIRLFANDRLFAESSATTWINEPYFGVFASTDEYSNSTARFEYYQVMPLDS